MALAATLKLDPKLQSSLCMHNHRQFCKQNANRGKIRFVVGQIEQADVAANVGYTQSKEEKRNNRKS